MYRQFTFFVYAGLVWLFSATATGAPTPMLVKHYDGGYSPALRPYLYDTLKTTLDLTMEEYGPYKIQTNGADLSTVRTKVETEKGKLLNVLFAAGWNKSDGSEKHVVSFDLPVFNDLLGMRALLARKNSEIEHLLKNRETFSQWKAGQGLFWEDVKILRHNGISVIEAHIFDALFPMLENGRFDYIPLSILEVDAALAKKERQFPSIVIVPNVYIFYPMAFNLFVNKNEKLLAKRIELGLERATPTAFNNLFDQYFPDLRFTKSEKNTLFVAYNPLISAEQNKLITDRFLQNYGSYFTILE